MLKREAWFQIDSKTGITRETTLVLDHFSHFILYTWTFYFTQTLTVTEYLLVPPSKRVKVLLDHDGR